MMGKDRKMRTTRVDEGMFLQTILEEFIRVIRHGNGNSKETIKCYQS
jgi:hypothetical protein